MATGVGRRWVAHFVMHEALALPGIVARKDREIWLGPPVACGVHELRLKLSNTPTYFPFPVVASKPSSVCQCS